MSRKNSKIDKTGSISDIRLVGFYETERAAVPDYFMTLTDLIAQINADSEVGDYTASDITNVPEGNITATEVQAALNELDTEKAKITGVTKDGIGVTQVDGTTDFLLDNTTAATVENQQMSPALRLQGQGWKTDATAGSQTVEFRSYVLPVQGAAAPSGILYIQADINDSDVWGSILTLTSAGVFAVASQITIAASTTALAGLNIAVGVAPTSPVEGDVWYDGTNFKGREDGGTITFGGGATFKSYSLSDIGTAGEQYLAGWFRAPVTDVELTVGGSATQTYGALGDSHAAHAFVVAATNGSFSYDVTVTGTHGTLVIDIDGVDYSQVYNTDAATTATDWIATHTAALGALGTPIIPLTGGAGIISMQSASDFVITDDSVGMSLGSAASNIALVVQTPGGSAILRVDIDGVDYDENFDTNESTTAAAWVATHSAALALLSPAITATNPAGAKINLAVVGQPAYTDQSIFGMGFNTAVERDITVVGVAGSLVININGVNYTEAFAVDADTTADNWRTTHTGTLAGLGDAITVTDGGPATITLVVASGATPTLVDNSSGGMSFTYIDIIVVAALVGGTMVIDVDSVAYSEIFDTDADTTADNWRTTHTATLAGLGTPITVTDGGPARIIFTTAGTPVIVDTGVGGMQFLEYAASQVTLAGTNGNTIIEVNSTDYTEAFDTNAVTTAGAFVTNQAAAILSAKTIIVTSVGAIIYFDHLTITPTIVDNSSTGFIAHTNAAQASGGVLTVSGISITDAGVKNDADSEILVADISAAATDQLYETTKKWLGQITFTISGEAAVAFMFNYGLVKYEDFGSRDFTLNDIELIIHAGANETGLEAEVFHYNSAEMTYSAGAFDPMAQAQYKLSTDHGVNNDIDTGFDGGWKRASLGLAVSGSASEGIICRVTTAVNNSISYGVLHIGVSI